MRILKSTVESYFTSLNTTLHSRKVRKNVESWKENNDTDNMLASKDIDVINQGCENTAQDNETVDSLDNYSLFKKRG